MHMVAAMNKTTLYARLESIGISKPYASQLASGTRTPSLGLALKIYKQLGIKLGPIAGASKADIAATERVASRVKPSKGEAVA